MIAPKNQTLTRCSLPAKKKKSESPRFASPTNHLFENGQHKRKKSIDISKYTFLQERAQAAQVAATDPGSPF